VLSDSIQLPIQPVPPLSAAEEKLSSLVDVLAGAIAEVLSVSVSVWLL
jgi:hypothetical protein